MPLRLTKRGEIWYVRGTVRGQYCYETTDTADEGLAEAFRSKKETELYETAIFGARAVVSFERAALSYIEDGDEERNETTLGHVARLVAHFAKKGRKVMVGAIDQVAADEAVKAIVGEDAAPATKNRGVYTPLIAILNHAAWRGWCERPKIKKKTPPKGKTRWLTPHECLALLEATSPHLRPLLLFILCTGARVSEACGLSWETVDLAAAKVRFIDTKNDDDRVARLSPRAITTLAELPHRDGAVFRTDDGEPYADKEGQEGGQFKTAWRTACRRAGLIVWEIEEGKAAAEIVEKADGPCTPVRWVPTATPHALRHTWASYFYALSKDLMLLKDEGGWRDTKMVERYTHLVPSEMKPLISLVWGPSHPRIGQIPTGAPSVQPSALVG